MWDFSLLERSSEFYVEHGEFSLGWACLSLRMNTWTIICIITASIQPFIQTIKIDEYCTKPFHSSLFPGMRIVNDYLVKRGLSQKRRETRHERTSCRFCFETLLFQMKTNTSRYLDPFVQQDFPFGKMWLELGIKHLLYYDIFLYLITLYCPGRVSYIMCKHSGFY